MLESEIKLFSKRMKQTLRIYTLVCIRKNADFHHLDFQQFILNKQNVFAPVLNILSKFEINSNCITALWQRPLSRSFSNKTQKTKLNFRWKPLID